MSSGNNMTSGGASPRVDGAGPGGARVPGDGLPPKSYGPVLELMVCIVAHTLSGSRDPYFDR